MAKLEFEDVFDRLTSGYKVPTRESVKPSALSRKLWVTEWHYPGQPPADRMYSRTKDEALEAAAYWVGDPATATLPKGLINGLRKYGFFQKDGDTEGNGYVVTIGKTSLAEVLHEVHTRNVVAQKVAG